MRDRRLVLLIGLICLASCWIFRELGSNNPVAYAQQPAAADTADVGVIRTETRLVLVDAVVTGKKGELHTRSCSERLQGLGRWQGAIRHQFLF